MTKYQCPGMHYGVDAIPKEWLNQLARLDYIQKLCEDFYRSLCLTLQRNMETSD